MSFIASGSALRRIRRRAVAHWRRSSSLRQCCIKVPRSVEVSTHITNLFTKYSFLLCWHEVSCALPCVLR